MKKVSEKKCPKKSVRKMFFSWEDFFLNILANKKLLKFSAMFWGSDIVAVEVQLKSENWT